MKVQTKVITTYVANDGKIFDTASECVAYNNSITPLWKQLGVDDNLVNLSDDNKLTSYYCEGVDLTEELENYTKSIVQEVYRKLSIDNSLTLVELMANLGLSNS